tara:strand:- start:2862 stop:4631 length:1770 start_codon:yes stop_codon:yes gene_type:complete
MNMSKEPTYLGKVISVTGSSVNIQLTPSVKSGLIMLEGKAHKIGQVGSFVRIPQGYNNLYGIISETNEVGNSHHDEIRVVRVELVGESIGIDFERGISQFPNISDEAHIVTEKDLLRIYGNNDKGQIEIGRLSSADSIKVSIDLDALVNKHSALLGSTGSGKSTSVASLLRSIVTNHQDNTLVLPSSRIVLFDLHGEYSSALSDISNVYSISPESNQEKFIIPYWCVSPDSLIDFLCGNNESLKNKFVDYLISEKTEYIKNNPSLGLSVDQVTQYTPVPFRLNYIWYQLSHYDSVTWNEKEQASPAYTAEGRGDFTNLIAPSFTPPATGSNPPFVGGKGIWKKQLDLMKARILDSQYAFFLKPDEWEPNENNEIEKDLKDLTYGWLGRDKPITILDLSGMPSSRLDLLLGSIIDVLFESAIWSKNLSIGIKQSPLLMVMEEAHRYLSKSNSGFAKNMVRRIAKEGRKFGVGSMLISQRPSEIDETILSQCGTLFAMRINNSTDRAQVKSAMTDGLSSMVDSLPILRTGEAIVTGEAARLPMRFRFRLPKDGQFPDSNDPKVSEAWSKPYQNTDFDNIIVAWRKQKALRD